jgi:hypothetical protein
MRARLPSSQQRPASEDTSPSPPIPSPEGRGATDPTDAAIECGTSAAARCWVMSPAWICCIPRPFRDRVSSYQDRSFSNWTSNVVVVADGAHSGDGHGHGHVYGHDPLRLSRDYGVCRWVDKMPGGVEASSFACVVSTHRFILDKTSNESESKEVWK